ncbi:MAG: hypothetical protein OEX22_11680 [Cyclobacteriaceae bacterium]|nr:hypothetical protein [Cyclobacteriaceae bacterium]
MKSTISKYFLVFLIIVSIPDLAFSQTKSEILDYQIEAFNQRDIEKYLRHMHDSIRIVTFPNKVTQKNIEEVRFTYSTAFYAKSLSGQMKIVGRREFGEYCIQEQWLEGFNSEPVMNYVLFKFKEDKIIEIVNLPKNWAYGR